MNAQSNTNREKPTSAESTVLSWIRMTPITKGIWPQGPIDNDLPANESCAPLPETRSRVAVVDAFRTAVRSTEEIHREAPWTLNRAI